MKYLCLIYGDERKLEAMAASELDALVAEHLKYDEALEEGGHLVVSEALASVRDAVTVRIRQGNLLVTDGPFAETKEQLTGFYLIDANDLDDAIQAASRIPSARVGSVEVRAVRELGQD